MSDLDAMAVEIAERVLTRAQLVTWLLRERDGLSWQRIAQVRGVSSAAVRDAHMTATRKIGKEAERVEALRSGSAGQA